MSRRAMSAARRPLARTLYKTLRWRGRAALSAFRQLDP